MNKTLHIVCLDAPNPPDYGGVFDLYFKIPALHALGIKIILHYFAYRENRNAETLEPYCQEIHSYPRTSFLISFQKNQPYIVSSRTHPELIKRLNQDDHPILLEGIHCCGLLPYLKNPERVLLRLHNDEAIYYEYLSKWEKNFLKKIYLRREASKLKIFQQQLPSQLKTLAVSHRDVERFQSQYHFSDISFLPCFVPWTRYSNPTETREYCLYHGNLTVSENLEAAKFLMNTVFAKSRYRLIIAGRGALKLSHSFSHIELIESPGHGQLNELIGRAQIHLLPSFNDTGVKIKLLNVLFNGRHCITNLAGVQGSGMENCVNIAESPEAMIQKIDSLMHLEFNQEYIQQRITALKLYDNQVNALKLSAQL